MLIPYYTDAPLYHRPSATIGVIIANVLVYVATVSMCGNVFVLFAVYEPPREQIKEDIEAMAEEFGEEVDEAELEEILREYEKELTPGQRAVKFLCLNYDVINPIQWTSSIFLHADPIHLILNMVVLWTFGLIVEGKLGWWKFLGIYLAIGTAQSAIEQCGAFLLVGEGLSLGASAAIYGLMAIGLVWAPHNEVHVLFFLFLYPIRFVVTVIVFAGMSIGLQVVVVALTGLTITSELLHAMGAGLGFVVGFGLLLMREVDCEGYDIITVWKGKEGEKQFVSKEEERREQQEADDQRNWEQQELQKGYAQIAKYLELGSVDAAIARFEVLRKTVHGAKWIRAQLYEVMRRLHKEQRFHDSIPLMIQYIRSFPAQATAVQLKLAQVYLVHESRPSKAIRLLDSLDNQSLSPEQRRIKAGIIAQAEQQKLDGVIDFEDED